MACSACSGTGIRARSQPEAESVELLPRARGLRGAADECVHVRARSGARPGPLGGAEGEGCAHDAGGGDAQGNQVRLSGFWKSCQIVVYQFAWAFAL